MAEFMQHERLTERHTAEIYAAVNFRLTALSQNEADIVRTKTPTPSDTHTSLGAVRDIDMEMCLTNTILVLSTGYSLYNEFYVETLVFIFA